MQRTASGLIIRIPAADDPAASVAKATTMARFQLGKSGNPGGRPRIIGDVQEVARQYTVEAISTLAAIMRNTKAPPAARVTASNSILDRGFGRPPQALSTTISARSVEEMTDEELMAIIAQGSAATAEH